MFGMLVSGVVNMLLVLVLFSVVVSLFRYCLCVIVIWVWLVLLRMWLICGVICSRLLSRYVW